MRFAESLEMAGRKEWGKRRLGVPRGLAWKDSCPAAALLMMGANRKRQEWRVTYLIWGCIFFLFFLVHYVTACMQVLRHNTEWFQEPISPSLC